MVSTVEAVDQLLPRDPRLFGASIDKPTTGQRVETAAINVWGWVLGRDARVRFVEILSDLGPPTRVPVSIDRRHVADAFPDVPLAARSGFAAVVDLRCARRTDSFVLQAGSRKYGEIGAASGSNRTAGERPLLLFETVHLVRSLRFRASVVSRASPRRTGSSTSG